MSSQNATPEFQDLIASAIESALLNVHVALPGIVQAYDAATQTCTVQPAVRRALQDEDGAVVFEDFAAIQNVPVVFPGGAGFSTHWPLAAGDTVDLVWQDFSIARWRARGVVSDPGDVRHHGPGYPVAIPWYRPDGGPGPDVDASLGTPGGLRLHFTPSALRAGTGADFVALAAKVDEGFAQILGLLQNWVVVPNDGGAALQLAAQTVTIAPTASSNLKAD